VTAPDESASAEARASTYGLLARLTLREPEPELLDSLRDLPIFGPALAATAAPDLPRALRVEYTRTFLMNVHPYESVFLDESGMLNAPSSAAVLEHYRQHGYEPPELTSSGAPDHLGLELGFMAHLVARAARAQRAGNDAVALALLEEQRHFLLAHLAVWAPIFGRALQELAASPFYRALGQTLEVFILDDLQALPNAA
jgi:putative dimethyl sulfoxide reductase chaperone